MWPCAPQQYQPLPISTGNVGVDRCGNVELYTPPRVVHARVCWPTGWPAPMPCWPWAGWGAGPTWPQHGGKWYGGGCSCGGSALASVLTAGAPLANWIIANRAQPAKAA